MVLASLYRYLQGRFFIFKAEDASLKPGNSEQLAKEMSGVQFNFTETNPRYVESASRIGRIRRGYE